MKTRIPILLLFWGLFLAGCSGSSDSDDLHLFGERRLDRAGFDAATGTLPLVVIETADGKGIKNKSTWKDAAFRIDGEDLPEAVQVKGRGNSSWNFPKKPWNVRFSEPVELLGMPASERWCFLANWRDPTLMRNAVSLEIARMTSLEWTPQGRFVEVVMDGTFLGNYYVTEKVEVAEGKVNVGLDGFLVCLDAYYDEPYRFKSSRNSLPVNIVVPEGCALDKPGFEAVRSGVDRGESAVYASRAGEELDLERFCDWFLIHELTGNDEPNRPHSVYMYRAPGGLLTAGPAWDFDFHTFRPDMTGWANAKAIWFDGLLSDPVFTALLKERWKVLRPAWEAAIPDYIVDTDALIAVSARQDLKMWPKYRSTNGDEKLSYDAAVVRLKGAFEQRLETLGTLIAGLP